MYTNPSILTKLQDIHALILYFTTEELRVNQMNTQICLFLSPFLFSFWLGGDSASPVTLYPMGGHWGSNVTPLSPCLSVERPQLVSILGVFS